MAAERTTTGCAPRNKGSRPSMSERSYQQPAITPIEQRPLQNVSGVLGSRLIFLGLVTFGATWLLLPIATVATALGYAALTIGGRKQATWGMRMAGLRV